MPFRPGGNFVRWRTLGLQSVYATLRSIFDNLEPAAHSATARAFRALHHLMLAVGIGAIVAETEPSLGTRHGTILAFLFDLALAFFATEYALRLIAAAASPSVNYPADAWHARWVWAVSPKGLVDLAAVLPVALALAGGLRPAMAHLFGVLWVLKLFRYAPGSGMLRRVFRDAKEALISVFVAFIVVLMLAGTLEYLIEGPGQPKAYGSIPAALWWTIVTLTTTGYGDVVPLTPLGRLVGSVVMVCGIAVFALWAGILASAFAREVHRREFLRSWDLITRVPFFRDLGAATIADIARILKPRDTAEGSMIMRRGDPGDCMYFIVSGEVEVQIEPAPQRLGPGQFFGEIALITGAPRLATAMAAKETQLLSLDIADFRQLSARRPELSKVVTEEGQRRLEKSKQARAGTA